MSTIHPRCQDLQAKLKSESLPEAAVQEAGELCTSLIQESRCDTELSEYTVRDVNSSSSAVYSSAGCFYSVAYFAEQTIKAKLQPPPANANESFARTGLESAPTPTPAANDLLVHVTKRVDETTWSLATTEPQELNLYILVDSKRKIYTVTATSTLAKLDDGTWKITYDLQLTGKPSAQTKGEIIVKDTKEWQALVIEIRIDQQNKAEVLFHAP